MRTTRQTTMIALAFSSLFFARCKKDYTCTCTTSSTYTSSSFSQTQTGTSTTSIKKVNKQHANQSCVSSTDKLSFDSGSGIDTQINTKNCTLS
jgi:K+-transporting ATPase c subunit